MNRNSKRKAAAAAKLLAHLKQQNPRHKQLPIVPKRRSKWQGHRSSNKAPQGTAWPVIK